MWQPNLAQWTVIWLSLLVSSVIWLTGDSHGRRLDIVGVIAVFTSFLVWFLSRLSTDSAKRAAKRILIVIASVLILAIAGGVTATYLMHRSQERTRIAEIAKWNDSLDRYPVVGNIVECDPYEANSVCIAVKDRTFRCTLSGDKTLSYALDTLCDGDEYKVALTRKRGAGKLITHSGEYQVSIQ